MTFFQNNPIRTLIDNAIDAAGRAGLADQKRRRYFGASQLGVKCNRASWYSFHWAIVQRFEPRMLRLFDRGHREEFRFVEWLRMIGCEIQEHDPATIPILWCHPESDSYWVGMPGDPPPSDPYVEDVTGTYHEWIARSRGIEMPAPKQFAFDDIDGHHKGNCDGKARFVPEQERWGIPADEWILLEFKTHNTKSFVNLTQQGVKQGKPEHYTQLQRYMHRMGMRLCLYGAVNKNDDDLYFEYIPLDTTIDMPATVRAREAIYAIKPPMRISQSPSWIDCKFCDYRVVCHYGGAMDKNCRSCDQSTPVADGRWLCGRFNRLIPEDFEEKGCDFWHQRTD